MSGGIGYFPNAPKEAAIDPQVKVGNVLAVTAVDWAMHAEQTARDHDYRIITGTLYGEVVAVSDDGFALAPQVFHDGDVRCTLVVPFVCVKHVEVLKAAT